MYPTIELQPCPKANDNFLASDKREKVLLPTITGNKLTHSWEVAEAASSCALQWRENKRKEKDPWFAPYAT